MSTASAPAVFNFKSSSFLGEKALREERRGRRRARSFQVVERAAEPFVHEDRDGCRAGFLELRGQVGGIGVGAEVAR